MRRFFFLWATSQVDTSNLQCLVFWFSALLGLPLMNRAIRAWVTGPKAPNQMFRPLIFKLAVCSAPYTILIYTFIVHK